MVKITKNYHNMNKWIAFFSFFLLFFISCKGSEHYELILHANQDIILKDKKNEDINISSGKHYLKGIYEKKKIILKFNKNKIKIKIPKLSALELKETNKTLISHSDIKQNYDFSISKFIEYEKKENEVIIMLETCFTNIFIVSFQEEYVNSSLQNQHIIDYSVNGKQEVRYYNIHKKTKVNIEMIEVETPTIVGTISGANLSIEKKYLFKGKCKVANVHYQNNYYHYNSYDSRYYRCRDGYSSRRRCFSH